MTFLGLLRLLTHYLAMSWQPFLFTYNIVREQKGNETAYQFLSFPEE